jgi:hypothetical protein
MSFKQWNAMLMLSSAAIVGGWVVVDLLTAGMPRTGVAAVAARLLWAGLAMIVINIAAAIGTAIVGSIINRAEFKDERADERDKAVYAKSMRNAYFVVSVGGLVTMFVLALGYDPSIAAYTVFGGGVLAGAAGALSQLVYYQLG